MQASQYDMLGDSNHCNKNVGHNRSPSVVSWAVGFEKVLADPVGLRIFTEFLRREFSAENIKFWVSCERYRNLSDKYQRKKLATEIVEQHLCIGAPEPVNIDSQTRQNAIEEISNAQSDLFLTAQKQIFNLMKFDCYQRFLKSDLFAESLTAEKLGKPLPCQVSPNLKSPKKSRSRSKNRYGNRMIHATKLNVIDVSSPEDDIDCNSVSDENHQKEELDEKKRKSLLPWQKANRGKSVEPERSESRSPVLRERNTSFRRSKRKTGEKVKMTAEHDSNTGDVTAGKTETTGRYPPNERLLPTEPSDAHAEFCRLILPDTSAAVLNTSPHESLGEAIQKLLTKRGLPPTPVEAFIKNCHKFCDLGSPLSSFCGQELVVESRSIIKLELPSRKVIAVTSKPDKPCSDVLEPVVRKYGLDIRKLNLCFDTSPVFLDPKDAIGTVNGRHIVVKFKDGFKHAKKLDYAEISKGNRDLRNITTVLLEELIRGKVHFSPDEIGVVDLENAASMEVVGSPESNEDVTRRNSFTSNKEKNKSQSVFTNRTSIHEGMGIKVQSSDNSMKVEVPALVTPRRNPVKNVHYRDSCDLTGVWNRAQKRLDDQRGTELNCELPDFLKPKREISSRKVESDL